MINHIFLSPVAPINVQLLPDHARWIEEWLRGIEPDIESGNVASSICLQGIIAEFVLYGQQRRDWLSVFEDYLTDTDGMPLAYSHSFGKRLFKFDNQWRQSPVHTIHTRWWVEKIFDRLSPSDHQYARLIENLIQPSGWIYDPSVSPTQVRTRMKSEYLMSFAMGCEILAFHNLLPAYQTRFETTLSQEPRRPYLSSEYFRLIALELLQAVHLVPVGLNEVIEQCETGQGYCDFSPEEKRDDYMGTIKRVDRDVAVHSPLAALHAHYLAAVCDDETKIKVADRLLQFVYHIQAHPLDIPAFKIRDLTDIPFGTGVSPLEVIVGSILVSQFNSIER